MKYNIKIDNSYLYAITYESEKNVVYWTSLIPPDTPNYNSLPHARTHLLYTKSLINNPNNVYSIICA